MFSHRLTFIHRLIFCIIPIAVLRKTYRFIPYFRFIYETKDSQTPITIDIWYNQAVRGKNAGVYWPCHETSTVQGWRNVYCGIETCPGYSPGNYISAAHGKIYIGDYTQIAPNVGLIAANHKLTDSRQYDIAEIHIGRYCWIGMGAVILPGVTLGDYTVVGAGSIVTKSFEEGFQIIGGNPAKLIKRINKADCVFHKSKIEYNGYIKSDEFDTFRKKNLYV